MKEWAETGRQGLSKLEIPGDGWGFYTREHTFHEIGQTYRRTPHNPQTRWTRKLISLILLGSVIHRTQKEGGNDG